MAMPNAATREMIQPIAARVIGRPRIAREVDLVAGEEEEHREPELARGT